MKVAGIIRKIDTLGRIVLPSELRKFFNLNIHDEVEILTDSNFILVRKYKLLCVFCSSVQGLKELHGKNICVDCLEKLLSESDNKAP